MISTLSGGRSAKENGAPRLRYAPLGEENYMPYYVDILNCVDGSYYAGSTDDLSKRIWQHQEGSTPNSYTYSRRPVELVWSEEVTTYHEALTHERQIKGWSRAKKEALIRGDFDEIYEIVKDERKRREAKKRENNK
jgi:predicted GIY-YIG superfamily endonuclease